MKDLTESTVESETSDGTGLVKKYLNGNVPQKHSKYLFRMARLIVEEFTFNSSLKSLWVKGFK